MDELDEKISCVPVFLYFHRSLLFQVTYCVHVENDNGQVVFLAHAGCCKIHYFQTALQYLIVGDIVKFRSSGVFFRISCINAVHACSFQHHIGFYLDTTQGRPGIGSKNGLPVPADIITTSPFSIASIAFHLL